MVTMTSSQKFHFQFCDKIADFLTVSESRLLCDEAHNNVMLGTALWCRKNNVLLTKDKVFILVFRGDETVAAIMWTKPYPLIFKTFVDLSKIEMLEIQSLLKIHSLEPDLFAGLEQDVRFLFRDQRRTIMQSGIMVLNQMNPCGKNEDGLSFRVSDVKDSDWLLAWLMAFYKEALPEEQITEDSVRASLATRLNCRFILEKSGVPVSLAMIVRETPSLLVLGGVYTPPEFRNQGFSQICVQKICEHILTDHKKFPALHANVKNPVSHRVYQKLGFKTVGSFLNYSKMDKGSRFSHANAED